MYLLDRKAVSKFFDVLWKMDRFQSNIYTSPGHTISDGKTERPYYYSQKEVFVRRTIKKWFSGKHVVLFNPEGYKEYLTVCGVNFSNGYSDTITFNVVDYTKPTLGNFFGGRTLGHNDLTALEGLFVEEDVIEAVRKLFYFDDIPEREFRFKAYNLNNTTKKNKYGEFVWTCIARTHHEAEKKRDKAQKEAEKGILLYGEILG